MRAKLKKILLGSLALLAFTFLAAVVVFLSVEYPGEAELADGTKRNVAQYVDMRDGIALAVDVWLPEELQSGQRVPTLMRATRYWRDQDLGPLVRAGIAFTSEKAEDLMSTDIQAFNDAGYAVVLVDVRGSGASFGDRPTEFGREEAEDLGEIVGWIAEQPWSNGRVGTWGVSYEGNTAAMAAGPANPALTAIAPQYADFDAWAQLLWPGGVFAQGFIMDWGDLVQALDAGDVCGLAGVRDNQCRLVRWATKGVKRVDGPDGEFLYEQARSDHMTPDIARGAAGVEFRDATFGASGETISDLSIQGYQRGIEESGAAIFSWAGWMDGGTVDGALALFSSFSNPVRLVIGPWSHGGGHHTDPFLEDRAPTEPSSVDQHTMLIDFMDHYVKEEAAEPGEGVGEIQYWTFNEGWKTAAQWPPTGFEPTRWFFGPEGALNRQAPSSSTASDEYAVDFTHSTGGRTRWHTQLGGADVVYGDRADEDHQLLAYTSEPMEADVEITGAVEVDLHMASSHEDGALFAYLEIVDPEGVSRYITEGQIRVIHRAECRSAPPYPVWGPCHTYREADALPMVPGESARIRFGLFNTSVLVPAGHRIRIALAGHDESVFDRYPAEGEPVWTVHRSRSMPSGVVIPMRVR